MSAIPDGFELGQDDDGDWHLTTPDGETFPLPFARTRFEAITAAVDMLAAMGCPTTITPPSDRGRSR